MYNVLSCFFPTTVVLVDDNAAFLENLEELVGGCNVICKAFTNPIDALEYVNEASRSNRLDYSDLIRDGEESTSDWKSILVNMNELHREIYSYDRFTKISLIISDYTMPEMNGTDFCSRVFDKSIQRILLTGIADDRKVIDAFNNDCITRFVKKGSNNFETDLLDSLNKSIYQYFRIHTEFVSKHISVSESTHLNDSAFAEVFYEIYTSFDFVEYYMLDVFGSYMFVDKDGNIRVLSVLTENEISRIIEVGVESEEIDYDVLHKLQSRKYTLASHSRIGLLPPVSEWGKHLKPAKRIDGKQTYYYTLLDESFRPDLDFDNIKSFSGFSSNMPL